MAEAHRSARLEARIAPEALAVVKRAAELEGRSLSDFVVHSALTMAHKTIEEVQLIRLSVDDQQAIANAILEPPPLTAAMERAIRRHRKIIRS